MSNGTLLLVAFAALVLVVGAIFGAPPGGWRAWWRRRPRWHDD